VRPGALQCVSTALFQLVLMRERVFSSVGRGVRGGWPRANGSVGCGTVAPSPFEAPP
jgi:hypothetical protein